MNTDGLWIRVGGVCLLMICLVVYIPGGEGATQQLWLPLAMAGGAWALTRNLTAVAIGGTVLAAIHSDLDAANWIERIAYPALGLGGSVLLAVIFTQRFRKRIADTHEARWSGRAADKDQGVDRDTGHE